MSEHFQVQSLMKYALHFHCFGDYADPRLLADLAREAEDAGWDGVFVSDHLAAQSERGAEPVANPWIALAAIATVTRRVRLGPMVAALPRRRPWQVASETATLDHLSGGRLVLGAGSGTAVEQSFLPFDEEMELRTRAAMLDEALDVLAGLWRGEPFHYEGAHYRVAARSAKRGGARSEGREGDAASSEEARSEGVTFLPRPVQQPRIPVWVAAGWPHRRPFRRAARWDGVFVDAEGVDWLRGEIVAPDTLRECVRYTLAQRPVERRDAPFDVVIGGFLPDDPARAATRLAPYAEAGVTWWVEGIRQGFGTPDEMRAKVRRGPPRA